MGKKPLMGEPKLPVQQLAILGMFLSSLHECTTDCTIDVDSMKSSNMSLRRACRDDLGLCMSRNWNDIFESHWQDGSHIYRKWSRALEFRKPKSQNMPDSPVLSSRCPNVPLLYIGEEQVIGLEGNQSFCVVYLQRWWQAYCSGWLIVLASPSLWEYSLVHVMAMVCLMLHFTSKEC